MYVELICYLGSRLIVVSMLMTSVVKLRIINTVGSVIFTGYALTIHSYPTAAMNTALVLINLYNIFKIFRGKREYTIVRLNPNDVFLRFFLDSHELDIKKFFPKFNKLLFYDYALIICHETDTIGIFLGKSGPDGTLTIHLDYTALSYRDSSVGSNLYKWLASQPLKKLIVTAPSPAHQPYLTKMGFVQDGEQFIKMM